MKKTAIWGIFALLFGAAACDAPKEEKQQETQTQEQVKTPSKPNIIYVMVDDLGYGDLGCFGQETHATPVLDQMAAEGKRFTQCYAGSPVCAPSRSTLMTGQHTGHTTVRGNKSPIPIAKEISPNPKRVPLNTEDVTLAEVMKQAGYITGMTGKWGLGEHGSVGEPNKQGYDSWLGFLNQKRAHDHFPDYFWNNEDTFKLEGNDAKFNHSNVTFSHNLFTEFALDFIENNADTNFFLYLPYCLPHDHFHIPEEDLTPFKDKEGWSDNEKVYAAMVRKIDMDMGKIFNKLSTLGLDSNTMVFFCSDNGAAHRWDGRFDSSGKLRGRKRDMYEGGVRTPMIVRMPGKVTPGTVSDYPWYFPDVLPTLAAFVETEAPQNIDGINVLDAIMTEEATPSDRVLYWEFHEGGFYQAIRYGKWKGVREGIKGKLELYDLSTDEAESNDISDANPEVVKQLEELLANARTESPYWAAK